MILKFVSPDKTEYNTEKSMAGTLSARNLEACFNASSASSEDASESSEYCPDPDDTDFGEPGCLGECLEAAVKRKSHQESSPPSPDTKKIKLDMARHLLVCETTQLTDFVARINDTSRCSTPDCNGKILTPPCT